MSSARSLNFHENSIPFYFFDIGELDSALGWQADNVSPLWPNITVLGYHELRVIIGYESHKTGPTAAPLDRIADPSFPIGHTRYQSSNVWAHVRPETTRQYDVRFAARV